MKYTINTLLRYSSRAIVSVVIAMLFLTTNSCSIILYKTATNKEANPDYIQVGTENLIHQNDYIGRKFRISLTDNSVFTAKLKQVNSLSRPEFELSYADFQNEVTDKIILPGLGSAITAEDTAGGEWNIQFWGLDCNDLWFTDNKRDNPSNCSLKAIRTIAKNTTFIYAPSQAKRAISTQNIHWNNLNRAF